MNAPVARRFTTSEYRWLTERGFFASDGRIELIHGEIVRMPAKGIPREACLTRLLKLLVLQVGDRATIRCQSPITLHDDSEPEPDFSIVENRSDGYSGSHPIARDVLLVIEISDSSLAYDRDTKLALYAKHGIPHYWIFNLVDKIVECHSQPFRTEQGSHGYARRQTHWPSESLEIPGLPGVKLNVAEAFSLSGR